MQIMSHKNGTTIYFGGGFGYDKSSLILCFSLLFLLQFLSMLFKEDQTEVCNTMMPAVAVSNKSNQGEVVLWYQRVMMMDFCVDDD